MSLKLKEIKKNPPASQNNQTQIDTSFILLSLKLLIRRQCGDLCSQPWSWHWKVSLWEIGKTQKFHQWLSGHTQYRMCLLWKKSAHYLWVQQQGWHLMPCFCSFFFFFSLFFCYFFFFSDVVCFLVTKNWTVFNTENNIYVYKMTHKKKLVICALLNQWLMGCTGVV